MSGRQIAATRTIALLPRFGVAINQAGLQRAANDLLRESAFQRDSGRSAYLVFANGRKGMRSAKASEVRFAHPRPPTVRAEFGVLEILAQFDMPVGASADDTVIGVAGR
jgi:hypothetical protein